MHTDALGGGEKRAFPVEPCAENTGAGLPGTLLALAGNVPLLEGTGG